MVLDFPSKASSRFQFKTQSMKKKTHWRIHFRLWVRSKPGFPFSVSALPEMYTPPLIARSSRAFSALCFHGP